MDYRHEWKHEISYCDLLILRRRLEAVASPDPHAAAGRYRVRSLYFDTPTDRALREKLDGAAEREKFRVRCYNGDISYIRLEKKSKRNGLGRKDAAPLTAEEVHNLLAGRLDWMPDADRPLVRELCRKMRNQLLRPKTLVDYTREAWLYGPGNVRVTLDYDIRTGLGSTDFLSPERVTIPARNAPILLEVKWDAFLPDPIRSAVQLEGRSAAAFSKYAACRVYG